MLCTGLENSVEDNCKQTWKSLQMPDRNDRLQAIGRSKRGRYGRTTSQPNILFIFSKILGKIDQNNRFAPLHTFKIDSLRLVNSGSATAGGSDSGRTVLIMCPALRRERKNT